jgi:hypothetical protein
LGKAASACIVCAIAWVVSVPFRLRVWRHLVAKTGLSLSPWMLHHLLFHLEWRVVTECGQIVVGNRFSFFFTLFSLSLQLKSTIILFVHFFVSFSSHSFNFLFHSFSFYISFFLFCKLVLQLYFLRCFIFNFSPHSFNFQFRSYSFYSFSPHSFNCLFHFYSF